MLKNHSTAGILQQNTLWHGLFVCRQQISQHGYSGQNARQNGNCKITFLQRSPPDMAIINNATGLDSASPAVWDTGIVVIYNSIKRCCEAGIACFIW